MMSPVLDEIARTLGSDGADRRDLFLRLSRIISGATLAGGLVAITVDESEGKRRGQTARRSVAARRKKSGKRKGKGKKKRRNNGTPGGGSPPVGPVGPRFTISGRSIRDTNGSPVVLRGVNKMSVFDDDDPVGAISFPEIRKTGANSVRIVWAITYDLERNGPATPSATLDTLIANARANDLVPMIELHDATGDWGRLGDLVAYWTQQPIVNIIKKHQSYLLVNIGNEVGDYNVSNVQFISGYTSAIRQLRQAGIHTPLIIDAPDWGKKLTTLNDTAATLLAADPDHNLIFSAHLYWGISSGADAEFIEDALQDAVDANYPLIIGEFSRYGAYAGVESICGPNGETDYRTIIEECQRHGIGWYAWEWGPGNGYNDPACAAMDMTPNRMFTSLANGWAKEVATTSPYSIKNTAEDIL